MSNPNIKWQYSMPLGGSDPGSGVPSYVWKKRVELCSRTCRGGRIISIMVCIPRIWEILVCRKKFTTVLFVFACVANYVCLGTQQVTYSCTRTNGGLLVHYSFCDSAAVSRTHTVACNSDVPCGG